MKVLTYLAFEMTFSKYGKKILSLLIKMKAKYVITLTKLKLKTYFQNKTSKTKYIHLIIFQNKIFKI